MAISIEEEDELVSDCKRFELFSPALGSFPKAAVLICALASEAKELSQRKQFLITNLFKTRMKWTVLVLNHSWVFHYCFIFAFQPAGFVLIINLHLFLENIEAKKGEEIMLFLPFLASILIFLVLANPALCFSRYFLKFHFLLSS